MTHSLRLLTLFCFLLLAWSSSSHAEKPLKIGFIYHGPVQEVGWTYAHDQARQFVEQQLGDKIETTYVDQVNESSDAERIIHKLARTGHDMIYTTSFGFMNPTIKAAKRFKKITFQQATGYKTAKNVAAYNARPYQGRYLTGLIAGKMTKSNTLGYIATFPIPEVIRGINAFTLGAKQSNPDVIVKVIWISSWYNPAKEREAAEALILKGADVLSTHTDSPTAVQTAQEKGIYAFGYHSDMSAFGADAHLTAVVHNWKQLYLEQISSVLDKTWRPEKVWYGLKQGVTDLSAYNPVIPADVIETVEQAKQAIINEERRVFTGPIYKQNGELALAEGESLDDEKLLLMNWYVDGIEGKIPGQ